MFRTAVEVFSRWQERFGRRVWLCRWKGELRRTRGGRSAGVRRAFVGISVAFSALNEVAWCGFGKEKGNVMATKVSAEAVLKDSEGIEKVWKDNPTLKLGKDASDKVELADYLAAKKKVTDFNSTIEDLRHQLSGALDDRDDAAGELGGLNTRALSAIRGIFGPDSAEYDQAGGTRTSERKPGKRTPKAPK